MSTEARNPRSYGLDKMGAKEIVRLMNEEESIVLRVIKANEAKLALVAERVADAFQLGGRVLYVGAGTSGRICEMEAAEMPSTFGISPDRFVAIVPEVHPGHALEETEPEDDPHAPVSALNRLEIDRRDVVIGVTASGRTQFVVSAVRHAVQKGVWTCGIANAKSAALLEEADLGILLETGPEVLTGSTRLKAGTAQKLALDRISTTAMVLSGKVIENLMVDVLPVNEKLKERCVRIVRELTTATEDEAKALLQVHGWNIRAVLDAQRHTVGS
jgi:N-acetylmuramic acid 6-phosphate etherase